MTRKPGDRLCEAGARKLAETIQKYWHGRGHLGVVVTIDAAHVGAAFREVIFVVRSNLIGGLPPADGGAGV